MQLNNQPGIKKLSFWSGQFCQTYAPAQDQCGRRDSHALQTVVHILEPTSGSSPPISWITH